MKKKKVFKKGQLAAHGKLAVLVTGRGEKGCGYPCFSGVVVMCEDDHAEWDVGTESGTWCNDAFEHADIDISKALYWIFNRPARA